MAKHNRINWHTGMEITPQVFIDADNFQIEQQNITRRLQVMPCYGLLPNSVFNADISIQGDTLSIKNLVVHAVTPQGEIIDINEQGKDAQKIDLSQYSGSFYITVSSNFPENSICVKPDYNAETSGMQIAKISNNNDNCSDYIPPCISINSHKNLLEVFEKIRQKTESILIEIKQQDKYKSIFLPLSLLELELKNCSIFETPKTLFLTIQKMALIFKLNIDSMLENTKNLLNEIYCHTEIQKMICLMEDAVCEIETITKAPIPQEKIPKIKIGT